MAEKCLVAGQDGCGNVAVADHQNESVCAQVTTHTSKRRASSSPTTAPVNKSPRTNLVTPTIQTHGEEKHPKTEAQETNGESTEGHPLPGSPKRRKSWRRATITRRSLPALPNPYHALCRSIDTSLPQHERLGKLMEASMKLAIERTQNSLQTVPNASLESFQTQVKHMQKEWDCLAKSINNQPQGHKLTASAASNPALQRAMENVQKAINRLQAENESWEALLNKHRRKAGELEKKVEQGQQTGLPLDSAFLTQSSQHSFIQSKPDYHSRQQLMLHSVEMIMDSQCKLVRRLVSIKEQSQLVVKETSGRLVAEAGFQELSSDLIRNLMAAPSSSPSTT